MAIKQTPIGLRKYYKAMYASTKVLHKNLLDKYNVLYLDEKAFYEEIKSNIEEYKKNKVNLLDYPEFVNNSYIDGTFYNFAKTLFINKKNSYATNHALYKLYKLARLQKELYEHKFKLMVYERMLDLTYNEYKEILRKFYVEVHKQMIINGNGYVLEDGLGWLCINRCKTVNRGKGPIDFAKTKQNKEKLLNEGKRLWNKDEAEYAMSLGIEYDGVDYRVYLNEEYVYEIPLINCHINNGEKNKFKTAYDRRYLVNKTEAQILEECNNDKNKICELTVDIREKLKLCLKVDDILYLNFIRNENQQSAHTPKTRRKS